MKAIVSPLSELLSKQVQYVIPVFQRQYRWERPQWERLWSSILDFRDPARGGKHFMGFLVAMQSGIALPGQANRYFLIDGQQRLTTLTLLLVALRNVARSRGDEDFAGEIEDNYLIHSRKRDEQRYRILPKELDRDALLAIIDSKPHQPGRMAEALSYFEVELQGLEGDAGQTLPELFHIVCQRLEFMSAVLDGENAYNIFKSLNSTGVPLGQSDLIRNFVFMHVPPDAHDDFDRDAWSPLEAMFADAEGRLDEERFSRFFRDRLMADGQYVQPKDTFPTFEASHEGMSFDPVVLAKAITADAGYYQVITGNRQDVEVAVTVAMAALNELESSTTYPLLLALFRFRAAGRITGIELAHSLDLLRGFILRRLICGESSRGYGQMFVRALAEDDGTPLATLEHYLLGRGWPHDALFQEAFALFPLYKSSYARHVLEMLERARGHKEQASLAQTQVEHVMPQTLTAAWNEALGDEAERVHAEWLHRPGNLTLSAYNQEVGNQPFAHKQARFHDSNVSLTRDIAKSDVWTEPQILERGRALAKQAVELWPGPKMPYLEERPPVQVEETRETRLSFWSGFDDYLHKAHPELPRIEPGSSRSVRLKSSIPRIVLEVRFKVSSSSVHVDVEFHRRAFRLWVKLRDAPQAVNELIDDVWTFQQSPKGTYGWMTVSRDMPDGGVQHWPSLYGWLGQKLANLYRAVVPYLSQELEVVSPGRDATDASPNEFASQTKLQQQRFWSELAKAMRENGKTLRPQKPRPQHWTNYAIGRSGIAIVPTLNGREKRIGVELSIGSADAKRHYHALLTQRDEIEQIVGSPLDWQEMPGRHSCRIATWRPDCDPTDESRWPEYVGWMTKTILRMESAFRPRVGMLE